MKALSERLSLIASLVPPGKSVCDVGTDHCFLPAALYLSGKYKNVTATDIREKPLENGRENLKKLKAEGVKTVLCDGLSEVKYSDAETVIIAGMGGEVISGIIERCPYKNRSFFILQPMTGAGMLRKYLADNGFSVESEEAVGENNKIYSVMTARFTGEPYRIDDMREAIGILKPETEQNLKYINKQKNIANKKALDLKGVKEKADEYKRASRLYGELCALAEEFNGD